MRARRAYAASMMSRGHSFVLTLPEDDNRNDNFAMSVKGNAPA